MREIFDTQSRQWEKAFVQNPDMFGPGPSYPAQIAADTFKREGKTLILELGGGQGRDTIFFARNGFHINVLDYSESAVETIAKKAKRLRLTDYITALRHDVRIALPFADESMEGCYSHMLYCMALTTSELEFLSGEVRRVLRPKGLHIYTVRNNSDHHFGKGIYHGDDMYEFDGFIVHFFSRNTVEHLAEGFQILSVDEFEEGELPRKLFFVILRKK